MPVVTGLDVQSQVRSRRADAALVSGASQRACRATGIDAMLLTAPPPLSSNGTPAYLHRKGRFRFVAITRDQPSKRVSSKGLNAAIPALLTNAFR